MIFLRKILIFFILFLEVSYSKAQMKHSELATTLKTQVSAGYIANPYMNDISFFQAYTISLERYHGVSYSVLIDFYNSLQRTKIKDYYYNLYSLRGEFTKDVLLGIKYKAINLKHLKIESSLYAGIMNMSVAAFDTLDSINLESVQWIQNDIKLRANVQIDYKISQYLSILMALRFDRALLFKRNFYGADLGLVINLFAL